jgi:hypothetical protein
VTCERFDLPGGGFAIVCSRGKRRPAPCSECKARPHEVLCDFELRGPKAGKTCSRKLCSACAVKRGELDLCSAHAKAPPPKPRARIFDHLDGLPEDRVFSRVARAMVASAWWSSVPARDEPTTVAGEVDR